MAPENRAHMALGPEERTVGQPAVRPNTAQTPAQHPAAEVQEPQRERPEAGDLREALHQELAWLLAPAH
jgi:hypothetical protein